MKTINWITSNGTKIEINLAAVYGLNLQGVRKTGGQKEIEITAKVNGSSHNCWSGVQVVKGHALCVARLGDIGLSSEQLEKINAVKAELAETFKADNDALDAKAKGLDALGNGDINDVFGDHC